MNVILTESVKGLGRPGDEVKVATGYAENYLLPKGLAVSATKQNLKVWQQKKAKIEAKESALRDEAREKVEKLKAKKITIPVKVGAEGKIYGSVTNKDIADAIKDQIGLEVEKKDVLLGEPIKQLGEQKVKISLFAEIDGEIDIEITATE